MMKSSLDHIRHRKQRELARALEILHEEFEDALNEGTADFKKRGRILKIILFGSYARGTFVDEPHTMKGYRSDFDLLVIVNNRKLTDHATYCYKAADRIIRDTFIETPTQFIVHSLREVNTELKKGHYFFSDIRKEGIVLYELDDEPLAEPKPLTAQARLQVARESFESRGRLLKQFSEGAQFHITRGNFDLAAFDLHQTIEQAYTCVLLTLTNYAPPSHNIKFLRSLAEAGHARLGRNRATRIALAARCVSFRVASGATPPSRLSIADRLFPARVRQYVDAPVHRHRVASLAGNPRS
ncbi:nucleotidyltransferase domain-containing protein [Agrobacterium cavarae]|uniref:nucleotidyltransferase domain-containing protein n=1 Tax=Agrobacterium cavarae TaxID=2528239 RepID=UPI001FDEC616|nr:nucleotidyltransferase domain-containing protein [Agrobacterium cavarae]